MQGFKSFADKTVLDFEEGITAVVGPNGSGKSNILDALRWVMGEMSAKTLRGANMQQIIFAGTEKRKPLNFAEVSLVLDNCDRTFPIDYDELIVTRRVFRSGESVYMINDSTCRLKDVQELFMDTGIGKGGYSMIGQGNVAQILSTKAEDRREFFEGAAGVSKYKHRKDEAQRKLDAAMENLTRVNDIVAELESQIGPLEHQSKKAKKYFEYYDEYKGLDVSMSLITISKNTELLTEAEKQKNAVTAEMDDLRTKEAEVTGKIDKFFADAKAKDEEKEEQTALLSSNEQEKMNVQNEIQLAQNNIKNNTSMCERIDREIETNKKNVLNMNAQIEEKRRQIAENEEKIKELTEAFDAISTENSGSFEAVNSAKDELAKIREELLIAKEAVAEKKAKISGAEAMRAEYISRKESILTEQTNAKSDTEELEKSIAESDKKAVETEEKRSAMAKRVDDANAQISSKQSELSNIQANISQQTVEYNSMVSKKRILDGMENDYEGYQKSVKFVLQAQELKHCAIYGALSGLIEVSNDYVIAIETALGGALQNIVVESEDDAKSAIAYLKENHLGRATFLPISSVKSRRLDNEREVIKAEGVVAVASDLVKCSDKYKDIIENLLGRTVIVDNIDNAIKLSKKFGYKFRAITIAGEVFNSGGSISGGSVSKHSGFLSRANEIKTLTAKIADVQKSLAKLKDSESTLQEELKNIENRLNSYLPLLRDYENEALIAKNTKEHLLEQIEKSGIAGKSISEELQKVEERLSSSADEVAVLIGEQRAAEHLVEELTQKESEKEQALVDLEEKKEASQTAIMEQTVTLRAAEKDIQAQKDAIATITQTISALESEEKLKLDEKVRILAENDELAAEITENKEKIEALQKTMQMIKSAIEEIDKEKDAIVSEQKRIQESNKDITDRMILLQQEETRAENKCERLASEKESIITRLWEDYELTPSSAEPLRREISDTKEASKRVVELKNKIKHLGSVNVDAIEEYKAVKERYEFLTKQKTDLEHSKADLTKVIESMQELMEEHFNKQFEEINKSFQKVFGELFGGGKGRLYLSEPENVLESGIEIEAQLPGKALQNMSLYSGGERTMIATALLFSILAVKPTPFCVLDEIDAALDDVNVSRFATYLKNYLEDTQFVVITHRRGTMEAANILYGVTMQEKGVTKMLSLAIDDVSDDMLK